jgi:hypothetical protein
MARTYLSTLSPRRRWGIAGCAGGAVLLLTVAIGNPWSWSAVSGFPRQPVADRVPLLAGSLSVFHWTVTPGASGAPAGHTTAHWVAGLILDLGWPLLVLLGARLLAGGLAMRRAKLSLVLGVWSLATFTAAAIGLVAGAVDHTVEPGMRVIGVPVAAGTLTGDVLALHAATLALLGAALGWLPGVTAAIGYSVRREPAGAAAEAESAPDRGSAGSETVTADLAALESLRRARRRSLEGSLPDSGTSSFFAAE